MCHSFLRYLHLFDDHCFSCLPLNTRRCVYFSVFFPPLRCFYLCFKVFLLPKRSGLYLYILCTQTDNSEMIDVFFYSFIVKVSLKVTDTYYNLMANYGEGLSCYLQVPFPINCRVLCNLSVLIVSLLFFFFWTDILCLHFYRNGPDLIWKALVMADVTYAVEMPSFDHSSTSEAKKRHICLDGRECWLLNLCRRVEF